MTGGRIAHCLAAELVGTFGLVFAGTGAVIVNAVSGGTATHVGIGLTFGLIVMAMIYAFGHVSGAHLNPAVTLAFAAGRHFPWAVVPLYWGAAQRPASCISSCSGISPISAPRCRRGRRGSRSAWRSC